QKEVALEYDLIEWAEREDGDRWLVVPTTKEALEAQPEFDRAAFEPMPADAEVGQTQPVSRDDLAATPTAPAADGSTTTTTTAPATSDNVGTTPPATGGGAAMAPADNAA